MENTAAIATLGPQVRLVVFKFLIRSELVPDFIPRMPVNSSVFIPATQGRKVLASTKEVWLAGLRTGLLNSRGDYLLVGARVVSERADSKSDVRFTFCHRNHVSGKPHPNFAANFQPIVDTFVDWTKASLWNTEAHMNPYYDLDNRSAVNGSEVLMLGCNSRTPAINSDGTPVMRYEGGREKPASPGQMSRGIGEKVPLLNLAPEIKMSGNQVLFVPHYR